MKRVLIFSTAYFPHVGGAEVAIREITDRLVGEYECDLICARFDKSLAKTERIGAVTVYRVGPGIRILDKLLSPFLGAFLALRLDRKRQYDLYWAMMATYGSGGAYIANILRFWRKVPIVLTLQEGDPPEYIRSKWFGLLGLSWRLALSQSSAVTVISSYLGELAKEFGYKGEPVLIPNGVDTELFGQDVSNERIEKTKKKVGKKEGETWLITTSRLVKKNAIDDVVRALALMPPSVHFLVLGTGPDEMKLKALTSELGVEGRIHFYGFVEYKDLPVFYRACDIFIRPSRSEGMGNSFIEAMAAGIPVIGTNEGGIKDFLHHEETGWVGEKDNPRGIAFLVNEIMKNPEEQRRITFEAKKLIQERYTWNTIAPAMKAVFDQMLEKR
jgi:glycosyltransferase involved in cell wall biosynthesis